MNQSCSICHRQRKRQEPAPLKVLKCTSTLWGRERALIETEAFRPALQNHCDFHRGRIHSNFPNTHMHVHTSVPSPVNEYLLSRRPRNCISYINRSTCITEARFQESLMKQRSYLTGLSMSGTHTHTCVCPSRRKS